MNITLSPEQVGVVIQSLNTGSQEMLTTATQILKSFEDFDEFKSPEVANLKIAFEECKSQIAKTTKIVSASNDKLRDKKRWLIERGEATEFTKISATSLSNVISKLEGASASGEVNPWEV